MEITPRVAADRSAGRSVSIWNSIPGPDIHTSDRDNYTGEVVDPQDNALRYVFDVATATSWHSMIRFSMNTNTAEALALLTVDEARNLIGLLDSAIKRVEGIA